MSLLSVGEGTWFSFSFCSTIFIKSLLHGTSLAVQWLRLHLPMQGVWVQSLVTELRSHMPPGQKPKKHKQQKQYCNKFNKDLKMVYIKKEKKS